MKSLDPATGARRLAFHMVAFVSAAFALASCGDDVDFCSNPGGEPCTVREYSVDLYVETTATIGALQLDVTHLGDSGGFLGRGDKVDCVPLVDAIVASNYVGEREVKIGLLSLAGIRTPAAVMRCGFRTGEDLEPADFDVEVTDASDTESNPIETPVVVVRAVTER